MNMNKFRTCVLMALLAAIATYFAIFHDVVGKMKEELSLRNDSADGMKRRPKILIWAKQYHSIGYTVPDLPNGDGGCDVTWQRTKFSSSDAVVFYMKSCSAKDLPDPKLRRKDQAFVWWAHESPWTVRHYYRHELTEFNSYFNWTMTYRADSDVLASFAPAPSIDYLLYKFGRETEMLDKDILKQESMSDEEFERQAAKLMSRKSKFAAWIASDCSFTAGAKKRMGIVQSMSEVLTFDKFGKCGTKTIPGNYKALLQTLIPYKFYFAFENSFACQDYITEKFFVNCLVAGTVPVVMGPSRKDVEKVVPPDAFIHVNDFENFKKLAEQLKYLDTNESAYMRYFHWWKTPVAQTFPRYGFNYGTGGGKEPGPPWSWGMAMQDDMMEFERFGLYHLCRKLRNDDLMKNPKVIDDLHKLWYGPELEECMA